MTDQIDHLQMSGVQQTPVSFKEQVTRLAGELTRSCEGLAALNDQSRKRRTQPVEVDALVAALTQTTHELASCAEEARDAHDQQTRYLTMVAHELRNPLNPIRAAATLLGTGVIDQRRLDRIKTVIEAQVTHLARLIDDLMETSRSHAANFQLAPHRIAST